MCGKEPTTEPEPVPRLYDGKGNVAVLYSRTYGYNWGSSHLSLLSCRRKAEIKCFHRDIAQAVLDKNWPACKAVIVRLLGEHEARLIEPSDYELARGELRIAIEWVPTNAVVTIRERRDGLESVHYELLTEHFTT